MPTIAGGGALVKRRVALVVGNGRYANATALANPPSDARAMAATLRELDFDVIDGFDLTVRDMDAAINRFSSRIDGADAALFFFAGHGLQVDGENYLVPIDAELENEGQLRRQTINLQDQLNMMSGKAAVSILLLDCCRDNPFVRSLKRKRSGATRGTVAGGLAEIGTDEGAFIAFATGPGSVAKDGEGKHSPFTQALLAHIAIPDLSLADIMTDVTSAVTEATGETQVPWYHSSLRKRFYFRRAAPRPIPSPLPAPEAQKPATQPPIAAPDNAPLPAPQSLPTSAAPASDSSPTEPQGRSSATPIQSDAPAPQTDMPRSTGAEVTEAETQASEAAAAMPIRLHPPSARRVAFRIAALAVLSAFAAEITYISLQTIIAGTTPQTTQPIDRPVLPTAQLGENAARLVAHLSVLDAGLDLDIARFVSGTAPDDERGRVLRAAVLMAQSQVIEIKPSATVPANCRAPAPIRPGVDTTITLVCAGLDADDKGKLLAILAAIPGTVWQSAVFSGERGLAMLAVADMEAAIRSQSNGVVPAPIPELVLLKRNLSAAARPDNLVTLEFADEQKRGNAQTIMDRLVSFGWDIKGVQRVASAAGLNEVRHAPFAADYAKQLTADLALQGLDIPAIPSKSIGYSRQLDIYISTMLAAWVDSPPQYGWCYQEYDGTKDPAHRYLTACHPTRPACRDARGTVPQKRQSDCLFVDRLPSDDPKLNAGGWANSYYAEAATEFTAPFPALKTP